MTTTGQLHHLDINVRDLAEARDFWEPLLTALGYTPYQNWAAGFSYRLGTTYLVFVQTEERFLSAGYHRKQIGLNHLAFTVATTQEVDELRVMLQTAGARELYADKFPHAGSSSTYTAYFEDPNRIKIEFITE